MSELDDDLTQPLPDPDAPRVEAVITKMMKRFPGIGKASQARYYEEVHQELAPLARQLERELREARRDALEEAANAIEPRNPPGDWTEYAKIRAEAAAAIRALSKEQQ